MTKSNEEAAIQFFEGVNEPVVPDIRLTRSRDGKTGQANFNFEQPQALSVDKMGEIKGMTMIDKEGILQTRDIKARFLNGAPSGIEATYTWKSEEDFQRFMRFAERYAALNGLGYTQK